MASEINAETYRVFLQVLTRAPQADTYTCEVTKQFDGGPRHGESYETNVDIPGNEFDSLPWDGEDGDIYKATWKLPAGYAVMVGRPGSDEVSLSLTHNGGIYVTNPFGDRTLQSVGRRGVMQGNRPGLDPNNPQALLRHIVDTDEAMIAKVLELLLAGDWQNADQHIAAYEEYDGETAACYW